MLEPESRAMLKNLVTKPDNKLVATVERRESAKKEEQNGKRFDLSLAG